MWGLDRATAVAPWLGWIDVASTMLERVAEIEDFVAGVRAEGFTRVVLCGMGGSSLAPLVFSQCVADGSGLPVHVLDLTNPASVLEVEQSGDLSTTLFIVSSKSGTTAEPNAFDAYFWGKVGKGSQFVAITDPDNPFESAAKARGWRKVFLNFPDIGGRFSALSYFGLVPAALLGIDLTALLERALLAGRDAFELGVSLGEAALVGRNKLTFITPEPLYPLGLWLEQLIAESTGKEGRGILPIAGEHVGSIESYGPDRYFAVIRKVGDDALDAASSMFASGGHPVADIHMHDALDVAQEMMRWEIATAIAGAVIGINPFDQPNVQESKDITKKLLGEVERDGALAVTEPALKVGSLAFYTDSFAETGEGVLAEFYKDLAPNDFTAIMAFLPDSSQTTVALRDLQATLRNGLKLATTMGYGPRFLHSTGQFHKGGPNGGFFIQLTGDHPRDAHIPGQRASWGQFVDAQAAGDLEALRQKGRRTLRIHLHGDLATALHELTKVVGSWLNNRNNR